MELATFLTSSMEHSSPSTFILYTVSFLLLIYVATIVHLRTGNGIVNQAVSNAVRTKQSELEAAYKTIAAQKQRHKEEKAALHKAHAEEKKAKNKAHEEVVQKLKDTIERGQSRKLLRSRKLPKFAINPIQYSIDDDIETQTEDELKAELQGREEEITSVSTRNRHLEEQLAQAKEEKSDQAKKILDLESKLDSGAAGGSSASGSTPVDHSQSPVVKTSSAENIFESTALVPATRSVPETSQSQESTAIGNDQISSHDDGTPVCTFTMRNDPNHPISVATADYYQNSPRTFHFAGSLGRKGHLHIKTTGDIHELLSTTVRCRRRRLYIPESEMNLETVMRKVESLSIEMPVAKMRPRQYKPPQSTSTDSAITRLRRRRVEQPQITSPKFESSPPLLIEAAKANDDQDEDSQKTGVTAKGTDVEIMHPDNGSSKARSPGGVVDMDGKSDVDSGEASINDEEPVKASESDGQKDLTDDVEPLTAPKHFAFAPPCKTTSLESLFDGNSLYINDTPLSFMKDIRTLVPSDLTVFTADGAADVQDCFEKSFPDGYRLDIPTENNQLQAVAGSMYAQHPELTCMADNVDILRVLMGAIASTSSSGFREEDLCKGLFFLGHVVGIESNLQLGLFEASGQKRGLGIQGFPASKDCVVWIYKGFQQQSSEASSPASGSRWSAMHKLPAPTPTPAPAPIFNYSWQPQSRPVTNETSTTGSWTLDHNALSFSTGRYPATQQFNFVANQPNATTNFDPSSANTKTTAEVADQPMTDAKDDDVRPDREIQKRVRERREDVDMPDADKPLLEQARQQYESEKSGPAESAPPPTQPFTFSQTTTTATSQPPANPYSSASHAMPFSAQQTSSFGSTRSGTIAAAPAQAKPLTFPPAVATPAPRQQTQAHEPGPALQPTINSLNPPQPDVMDTSEASSKPAQTFPSNESNTFSSSLLPTMSFPHGPVGATPTSRPSMPFDGTRFINGSDNFFAGPNLTLRELPKLQPQSGTKLDNVPAPPRDSKAAVAKNVNTKSLNAINANRSDRMHVDTTAPATSNPTLSLEPNLAFGSSSSQVLAPTGMVQFGQAPSASGEAAQSTFIAQAPTVPETTLEDTAAETQDEFAAKGEELQGEEEKVTDEENDLDSLFGSDNEGASGKDGEAKDNQQEKKDDEDEGEESEDEDDDNDDDNDVNNYNDDNDDNDDDDDGPYGIPGNGSLEEDEENDRHADEAGEGHNGDGDSLPDYESDADGYGDSSIEPEPLAGSLQNSLSQTREVRDAQARQYAWMKAEADRCTYVSLVASLRNSKQPSIKGVSVESLLVAAERLEASATEKAATIDRDRDLFNDDQHVHQLQGNIFKFMNENTKNVEVFREEVFSLQEQIENEKQEKELIASVPRNQLKTPVTPTKVEAASPKTPVVNAKRLGNIARTTKLRLFYMNWLRENPPLDGEGRTQRFRLYEIEFAEKEKTFWDNAYDRVKLKTAQDFSDFEAMGSELPDVGLAPDHQRRRIFDAAKETMAKRIRR